MTNILKTNIAHSSIDEVDKAIQEILQAKGVIFPTVENWSMLAMPGRDTVTPLRSTALGVQTKTEGTALTPAAFTLSGDAISLNIHQAQVVRLENFAQLQTGVPNIEGHIAKLLGEAFVQAIESALVTVLVATSASAPDHQIAFDTSSTLAEADILEAMELLDVQNVPSEDRYLLIPPAQHVDLLAVDRFTRADTVGNGNAIINGVVGYIHGFRVIKSTLMTANKCVAYHKSHVGIAIQQGMALMRQPAELINFAEDFGAQMVYGTKTFDSGKRGVLIG